MISCGPDARLDMVGMFAGSSPTIDERFEQSQEYNNKHGIDTLKALTDGYKVHECTATHISTTQVK